MDYTLIAQGLYQKAVLGLKNLFIPSEQNDYKPRFLQSNILLGAVVLLLLVRVGTLGFSIPFSQNIFFADITKTDLLSLLNQTRENAGLAPLADNQQLDEAATMKAEDMVKNDYFAHQSPAGVTPWYWFLDVGYDYKYAGENLAVGFFNSTDVFNAWLNSPEHKANLLDPNYTQVGTAVLPGFGNTDSIVVVQDFGSPQLVKTVAIASKPATTVAAPAKAVPPQQSAAPAVQIPAQKTVVNAASQTTAKVPQSQKVLGNETQIGQSTQVSSTAVVNNFYNGIISFMAYDYEALISDLAYVLLLAVCIALLLNVLINFNVQRPQLILKSLVVIMIIASVILLNKDFVGLIIPHTVTI